MAYMTDHQGVQGGKWGGEEVPHPQEKLQAVGGLQCGPGHSPLMEEGGLSGYHLQAPRLHTTPLIQLHFPGVGKAPSLLYACQGKIESRGV